MCELNIETHGPTTFILAEEGSHISGGITVLADCVGIFAKDKFICLPIELWNAIVDQYESSRT